MAKNVEVKEVVETSNEKRYPLKLKIGMATYEGADGKPVEYVAATLIDPFAEFLEDFNNVRIAPRWDRDQAIFKVRMGKYLRTHNDIILEGYCEPVGYQSKDDESETIYYPGIFFNVPYTDKLLEFGFKKKQEKLDKGKIVYKESPDAYVFRDLIAELWGGTYEPAVSSANIEE